MRIKGGGREGGRETGEKEGRMEGGWEGSHPGRSLLERSSRSRVVREVTSTGKLWRPHGLKQNTWCNHTHL